MAPATCLAQLLLLAASLPFAQPGAIGDRDLRADEILRLAGAVGYAEVPHTFSDTLALLGAGQIGLGLVLLTIGARLIPAAQVALITLLEVVLGPLWVWIALSEQPDNATLAGGAIVIAAVIILIQGDRPIETPEPAADTAVRALR